MFVLLFGHDRPTLHSAATRLHAPDTVSVLAVTTDPSEVLRLAPLCAMVIIDYRCSRSMPSLVRHLAPLILPTKIIVLHPPDDPTPILACLAAGAAGFLRPSDWPATARTILQEAHQGYLRVDAPIARLLFELYRSARHPHDQCGPDS